MTLFSLIAISLSAFRLASLVVYEHGPCDIFMKLRSKVGIVHDEEGDIVGIPDKLLPKAFSCFACMSVWMAGISYIIWYYEPIPVWILGASGGAMLVERINATR